MTAADLDPTISKAPSNDVLASRLADAVPQLDEDQAEAVIDAVAGDGPGWKDRFRIQLGYRLDQARISGDD